MVKLTPSVSSWEGSEPVVSVMMESPLPTSSAELEIVKRPVPSPMKRWLVLAFPDPVLAAYALLPVGAGWYLLGSLRVKNPSRTSQCFSSALTCQTRRDAIATKDDSNDDTIWYQRARFSVRSVAHRRSPRWRVARMLAVCTTTSALASSSRWTLLCSLNPSQRGSRGRRSCGSRRVQATRVSEPASLSALRS